VVVSMYTTEFRTTYFHGWDPDRRTDVGQDNVAWYFSNNIANSPTCLHVIELITI
jgi:hypothetical protein